MYCIVRDGNNPLTYRIDTICNRTLYDMSHEAIATLHPNIESTVDTYKMVCVDCVREMGLLDYSYFTFKTVSKGFVLVFTPTEFVRYSSDCTAKELSNELKADIGDILYRNSREHDFTLNEKEKMVPQNTRTAQIEASPKKQLYKSKHQKSLTPTSFLNCYEQSERKSILQNKELFLSMALAYLRRKVTRYRITKCQMVAIDHYLYGLTTKEISKKHNLSYQTAKLYPLKGLYQYLDLVYVQPFSPACWPKDTLTDFKESFEVLLSKNI